MAQPVGPLFGTRWPNRGPVPVPARTFPALALLGAKKFQVGWRVPRTVLVPLCGAGSAPPSGRSRTKSTELVLDLEQVSISDLAAGGCPEDQEMAHLVLA